MYSSRYEKDTEIEQQLQDVYKAAMDAFDNQNDVIEEVEGKYVARNAEVAVQFLNAALAALREKSTIKQHKDKLQVTDFANKLPKTVNNNLIIDRNELLKLITEQAKDITPSNKK